MPPVDWGDAAAFCSAHRCRCLRDRCGRWTPFYGSDDPCVSDFLPYYGAFWECYAVDREVVSTQAGEHIVWRVRGLNDIASSAASMCRVSILMPYGGM